MINSLLICNQTTPQTSNKNWHSTKTSLTETTDTTLRAIEQRMLTSAVFLDMSKTFDSVNHETLILKLQNAGDSKSVIQWFCSWLNDHHTQVASFTKFVLPE